MINNISLEQHRYSAVKFARNERYRTTHNAEMMPTVAMATDDSTSSAVGVFSFSNQAEVAPPKCLMA